MVRFYAENIQFLDRKASEFGIPNVKLNISQIIRTGRLPAAISFCLWKSNNPRIIGQKLRYLKLDVPIAFSSPRALPEVVLFWCQMKAHIFLIITPKFQLQIYYTLEVKAENVPISSIPILIFLYTFMTALSSVSHTYFCPSRENKKHPWGTIVQND